MDSLQEFFVTTFAIVGFYVTLIAVWCAILFVGSLIQDWFRSKL